MKFEIDQGIAFVKGNQVEVRTGCMMAAKATIKQSEVMILETSEEWDK